MRNAPTGEEIRALFTRIGDAYQRHDPIALAANYTDDCVLDSPIGGLVEGRAGVEQIARITFDAFPDFHAEVDEILAIGDRVVLTLTIHGTDTGGLFGFPPTGKRIRVPSVFLFTLRDQRVARERRTYDFSGFLLQLTGDVPTAIASARLYRGILERAQLERDVRVAADIQRALLPDRRYRSETADIAAVSVPCRAIGGDFFDYFELPDAAVGFVVGDVSGKGPPAALLTAVLQGILAVHAYGSDSPAVTIERVNQALARRAIEARFATMFYGVLGRPDRRRLQGRGVRRRCHSPRGGRHAVRVQRRHHRSDRSRRRGIRRRPPDYGGRVGERARADGARRCRARSRAPVHRRCAAGRRHDRAGAALRGRYVITVRLRRG
ncbi:MAG: ester cyclase [Acidobacteria bacterium]|nr:ester cyclase [Acidobacteriota bacterium]